LKQIIATVIGNKPILGKITRRSGRGILSVHIIRLRCPQIEKARPGQFVMARCGGNCILPRPLSIHQANVKGDVSLYFAVLEDGKGTSWLSQRKIGDKVALFGPLGDWFHVAPASRNLLLVAGGMGIAPLWFLAEDAREKGLSVTLLYGAAIDNPYPEVFQGIKLIKATEDGSAGYHGMVTDLIPEYIDWADQVFACGPTPMYKDMSLKRQKLGLEGKPVQVSLEVRMGCGLGVCYGCTIKTKSGLKQVCKDGPVFDLDDILWDEVRT
jgi:dihydroorotate dehydrogenase electron transfer subunit